MSTTTKPPITSRYRLAGYWSATALLVFELGLGGVWDLARLSTVRDALSHLGYPSYLLPLLGVWHLLGAVVLILPRFPVVKEWVYAGMVFLWSTAMISHLTTGYELGKVAYLTLLLVATVVSWTLRHDDRRAGPVPTPCQRSQISRGSRRRVR